MKSHWQKFGGMLAPVAIGLCRYSLVNHATLATRDDAYRL